jgi:hypothetical protein
MIEMIVCISPARIVTDPAAVGVDVGRVWMPRMVLKVTVWAAVRHSTSHRRRTVVRNETTAEAVRAATASVLAAATVLATATVLTTATSMLAAAPALRKGGH